MLIESKYDPNLANVGHGYIVKMNILKHLSNQ